MTWSHRDEERLKRQSREMASGAQRQWAGKHPILNCCLTTFALGFLGLVAIFIGLGLLGVFDSLG